MSYERCRKCDGCGKSKRITPASEAWGFRDWVSMGGLDFCCDKCYREWIKRQFGAKKSVLER